MFILRRLAEGAHLGGDQLGEDEPPRLVLVDLEEIELLALLGDMIEEPLDVALAGELELALLGLGDLVGRLDLVHPRPQHFLEPAAGVAHVFHAEDPVREDRVGDRLIGGRGRSLLVVLLVVADILARHDQLAKHDGIVTSLGLFGQHLEFH